MPNSTEYLIKTLARDVPPVRRLPPPMRRAAVWLAVIATLGALAIATFARLDVFTARAAHPALEMELIGTLATGCLAVIAAFHLSLPDRSLRWAFLPLPTLALWLAGSGESCYREWIVNRDGAWRLGDSVHCLAFIVGVGLPLGVALLLALRRSCPIARMRVAVVGGLGASSLAAFFLQFFHPFDVTLMDLALHAIAVALVISSLAWQRSWVLGTEMPEFSRPVLP
jgi:hypothetical protein